MNEQIGFREKLRRRQQAIKSLLCVGLDPKLEKLPEHLKTNLPHNTNYANAVLIWMMKIVDATAPYTSMYKINIAHWEAIPGGVEAMRVLVAYIKYNYSDIVVFGDVKRGDIGRTQECYGIAHFEIDGFEGINFSPYMGKDCMEALVNKEHLGRAIVGLCYTSNPAARQMQNVPSQNEIPYWEYVANWQFVWAHDLGILENAGLVMAAAYEFPKNSGIVYSEHLKECREIVGDKMWFLIPGVGTQGGYIKETVKAAHTGWGSIAINSSSEIIFASSKEDFAEAAAEKAKQAYLAMAEALEIPKSELIPEALIDSNDHLATLKNFDAYYKSPKDEDGKFTGPLVAYAGTYPDYPNPKNYVGFEYFNFAKIETEPVALDCFAKIIAKQIKESASVCNSVIGAPMGGIMLASAVGRILNCQTKFSEKKIIALGDPEIGTKDISRYIIDRHQLLKGSEVFIIEDVCNNFSTTASLKKLIEAKGAKLAGIACAINRSGKTEWEGIPVISALYIPTNQYRQDDLEVSGLIESLKIVWKPKDNWAVLKKAMEE